MKINFKLNKRAIFLALVCVWGVFAVWYVANDQWQDFKAKEMTESYQAGSNDTVKAIIEEVSKCQQLPLFNGEDKVNVVSVECLQKNQPETPAQPPVQAPISQPVVEQGL